MATPDSGRLEWIRLELIDAPERAQRTTMDENQLHELITSIRAVGLIQPLVLEKHGARFRVVAGHRRLIACQALALESVPCVVRKAGAIDPAAVTVAENYFRESVNPAEEALFLSRLLTEKCDGDMERLAALIRHRVEYCDDRLALLRGDLAVLDALRQDQISLAVARELNRTRDAGQRSVFLDAAVRGGATAAVVRRWRTDAEGSAIDPAGAGAETPAPAAAAAPIAVNPMTCMFCGESEHPHLMECRWIHQQCGKFLNRILDNAGAAPAKGE